MPLCLALSVLSCHPFLMAHTHTCMTKTCPHLQIGQSQLIQWDRHEHVFPPHSRATIRHMFLGNSHLDSSRWSNLFFSFLLFCNSPTLKCERQEISRTTRMDVKGGKITRENNEEGAEEYWVGPTHCWPKSHGCCLCRPHPLKRDRVNVPRTTSLAISGKIWKINGEERGEKKRKNVKNEGVG